MLQGYTYIACIDMTFVLYLQPQIQISPQISQHSQEHVHHLVMYACDLTGVDISVQGPCTQLDNTAAHRIPLCTGIGELIGSWAIGGQV